MYVAPSSLLMYSRLYYCKGGISDTSKSMSPLPTSFTCAVCKTCWACPAAVKGWGGGRSVFTLTVVILVFFATLKCCLFCLKNLLDTPWISSSNSSCSSLSKVLIICLAMPQRTNSTGWSSCYAILRNLLNCSSQVASDLVFLFLPGSGVSLSLPVTLVLGVTWVGAFCSPSTSTGSAWGGGAAQFDVVL